MTFQFTQEKLKGFNNRDDDCFRERIFHAEVLETQYYWTWDIDNLFSDVIIMIQVLFQTSASRFGHWI